MADESSSPRNPLVPGGNPHNSASEAVLPATEINQDAKPPNPQSVFVNSEPIREDQVRNAVNFLSHPKVRSSAVIYRRSFLEKKGLTKEEIDEAFRRVPDPQPSAQTTDTNQEKQGLSSSSSQPTVVAQTPQPVATGLSGGSSSMVTLARSRFHWYHAVCAVGFLAATGAGTVIWIKKSMIPRLKYWIRKVVLEEKDGNRKFSMVEEAASAAKAAAAAATEVAKTSQDLIISRSEEKAYMENFMNLLDMQVKEMRSMSNSMRRLEALQLKFGKGTEGGNTDNIRRTHPVELGDYSAPITYPKQPHANGKPEIDSRSEPSPATSAEPSVAPHPKSYMEIMAMIQRGERPPNIRDINDQPPNPNQQIANPRLAPRSKPWEVNEAKPTSRGFVSSVDRENLEDLSAQSNGVNYQLDGESTVVPWWQKKNPRITDLDYEEAKSVPAVTQPLEQPIQRTWVPPQPPPIAMPEAAEAIRRPKPKKDTLADDQSVSRSQPADELQRVTKISESGGEVEMHSGGPEMNGESSTGLKVSEIEEESEHMY